MKINVSEAMVKTAAVEIKTLTISGKQVTLAVFRQLQEADLVDPSTCQLRGVPWGRVNYHPDPSCKTAQEHIHVVWQKGSELRRSAVSASHPWDAPKGQWETDIDSDDAYVTLLKLAKHITPESDVSEYRHLVSHIIDRPLSGSGKFIMNKLSTEEWLSLYRSMVGLVNDTRVYGRGQYLYENAISALSSALYRFSFNINNLAIEDITGEISEVIARASDKTQRRGQARFEWEKMFRDLESLDQLFIAV